MQFQRARVYTMTIKNSRNSDNQIVTSTDMVLFTICGIIYHNVVIFTMKKFAFFENIVNLCMVNNTIE